MKIETIGFGPQEVDPETVIEFPDGMPGFEGNKQFKLFFEKEGNQVYHLISASDPNVAFSVIDPASIHIHYEMTLTDEEDAQLKNTNPENIMLLIFVYKNLESDQSRRVSDTALAFSFMNPIVIDMESKRGIMKHLSNVENHTTIRSV
jgi:flagellar assembly factor FliW